MSKQNKYRVIGILRDHKSDLFSKRRNHYHVLPWNSDFEVKHTLSPVIIIQSVCVRACVCVCMCVCAHVYVWIGKHIYKIVYVINILFNQFPFLKVKDTHLQYVCFGQLDEDTNLYFNIVSNSVSFGTYSKYSKSRMYYIKKTIQTSLIM